MYIYHCTLTGVKNVIFSFGVVYFQLILLRYFRIIILFFPSCLYFSCKQHEPLFIAINSSHSGILFNNRIIENDSINALDLINIYNGGGVGIGDFNNDGLQDVYFTGNMVSNKMYLNRGDFKFEDITDRSNTNGEGKWARGVSVVDINNDGLTDLYVCNSIADNPKERENILYVNLGIGTDGMPVFADKAGEYGLDDNSHSTMASFFDCDNDGDLDMYLTVNVIPPAENPSYFRTAKIKGEHPSTGKLYRNDWNEKLRHPYYTDISKEAGITIEGYGHSASVADINNDGWKDIYVANDFLPDNILYINNHNGTFTNKVKEYFSHTSNNSMGQDVVDINNDGLQDVIELDMNPEDNFRKKTMMNSVNYNYQKNFEKFGLQHQYVRNVLQLNLGPRIINGLPADPAFSDIGYYAGIAETDWSWAPLVVDFDNDGYRDIIITNGFPKDITDHDFGAFRNESSSIASKSTLLEQIPEVKLKKYAFRNNGDLTFENVSTMWGFTVPSFSNGAAYADFDNDGDMDVVINNINDEATLYRNNLRNQRKKEEFHYLQINLRGDSLNRNGLGSFIYIYYDERKQIYEHNNFRGYLSSVQLGPHFGLGSLTSIDSLVVLWPDGRKQKLENVASDSILHLDIRTAKFIDTSSVLRQQEKRMFTSITDSIQPVIHYQKDFNDFNIQRLLPHKFSESGPALAVGDIDKDGRDDIVVGGNADHPATLLLQIENNNFLQRNLQFSDRKKDSAIGYDAGILLFDADADGDLDIYVCKGGYEKPPGHASYQDELYLNDGKGLFTVAKAAIPANLNSKSCVRAADFDKDGDLDLFVGGRVMPWNYPKAVSSYIYRNDSQNKKVKFTDVTTLVAKDLIEIGLVSDAIYTDFNNDGWLDLMIAGECMPIVCLRNEKGIYVNATDETGISHLKGLWSSITGADLDKDGDTDYIVGNSGENSLYRGSEKFPLIIYGKDFDDNGLYECIPARFFKSRSGLPELFPLHTRDDVVDQFPFVKKKFPDYKSFANAGFKDVFSPGQLEGALSLEVNYFKSVVIENRGNGNFEISPLPVMAQLSPVKAIVAEDLNGDGNVDVMISGNDYGTDVSAGQADALKGVVFQGEGNGKFATLSIAQSGIYIPGDARALVTLNGSDNKVIAVASQNKGRMSFFLSESGFQTLPINPDDEAAEIIYRDGRIEKREFFYGSSYLSQSARHLRYSSGVKSIKITNTQGRKRELLIKN